MAAAPSQHFFGLLKKTECDYHAHRTTLADRSSHVYLQRISMPDIRCRLTKKDGSTVTVWLPGFQVEAMADPDSPEGVAISEALGVVSIEVDVPGDDKPPMLRWN